MKLRSLQYACQELKRTGAVRVMGGLLPAGQRCYLVGGAVRDLFLSRPCKDYDFITPFDPTSLARRFSRKIRGHWFMLDEARRQSRVVVDADDTPIQCDFAPLRASSLTGDLTMRDYRINAMVWRVHGELDPDDFYDPLSGYEDLRCGRLVACSRDVLGKDPLRVLKGARHCKTLGLSPDNATGALMIGAARMLPTVAAERVKKELGLLMSDASPDAAMQWLWRCGASGHVLGPWSLHVNIPALLRRLNRFGVAYGSFAAENTRPWYTAFLQKSSKRA